MPPTVLITRPEEAGLRFADQLRARWGCGIAVVLSPLMRIEYLDRLPELDGITGLIFTSRHGVHAFSRLCPRRDLRCFAVGPATARAARAEGFDADMADGDAPALIRRIRESDVQGPLLHIRGEHAAGDIAGQLTRAGIETREAVLYTQQAQELNDDAKRLLSGGSPVIIPLFSPRSAKIFFAGGLPLAPLFVAAISENAADMVPQAARQHLAVADTPDLPGMLRAIEALMPDAKLLEGGNRAQ